MLRLLIFLIIFVGLIACESKVQSEDLIPEFNNTHLRSHVTYTHKYDGNRLSKTYEATNLILNGQVVDTFVSIKEYEYCEKGLLANKKDLFDTGEAVSNEFYKYNSLDSLVELIQINSGNDTIFWEKYNYYPDGRRLTFRRVIGPDLNSITNMSFSPSNNLIVLEYERHEYIYSESLCIKQVTYSEDGSPIKYIYFEYDDHEKLIKEIHTKIFDGLELTEKTKHYNYSKSQEFPDFFALDTTNRRIEELYNEFKDDGTMIETRSFNYGNSIIQTIFENGKEVGVLIIEKEPALMVYDRAIYNENGDIKELFNYWKE
jgi:hypothetical protein